MKVKELVEKNLDKLFEVLGCYFLVTFIVGIFKVPVFVIVIATASIVIAEKILDKRKQGVFSKSDLIFNGIGIGLAVGVLINLM